MFRPEQRKTNGEVVEEEEEFATYKIYRTGNVQYYFKTQTNTHENPCENIKNIPKRGLFKRHEHIFNCKHAGLHLRCKYSFKYSVKMCSGIMFSLLVGYFSFSAILFSLLRIEFVYENKLIMVDKNIFELTIILAK